MTADLESLPAPELLAVLRAIPAERREMRARHLALMRAGRAAGMTWDDMARHLDLGSRQAAQQRFRQLEREETKDLP
ncbi:MAG TPA: hypothetical protein VMV92_03035 [Streptosporangiaceae bacterium]|nr:hypothetical protein [Streptosporangiaceae bacterium]